MKLSKIGPSFLAGLFAIVVIAYTLSFSFYPWYLDKQQTETKNQLLKVHETKEQQLKVHDCWSGPPAGHPLDCENEALQGK